MADLPVGIGGRAREKKIDSMVDQMVGGGGNSSASPPVDNDPRHPAARHIPYNPSDQEKKTRNYGAPIQDPIVK